MLSANKSAQTRLHDVTLLATILPAYQHKIMLKLTRPIAYSVV